MTNTKSNFQIAILIVAVAALVGNSNSLLAQNTTPPSDISSYISSRKSTASKIVSDLKSDKELPNKWPHAHTDKILSAAEKLSSKYKASGKPGQGTDTARTWADWVAKEILLWGHIEKDLSLFGQLHNDIIDITKKTKTEIEDTRKLIQDFKPAVTRLNDLLKSKDEAIEFLRENEVALKFFWQYFKLALANEGVDPPEPLDAILMLDAALAKAQFKVSVPSLDALLKKLTDGFQKKFRSSGKIHMTHVFLREIPYKLDNLKKETDEKYSDIKRLKADSANAVKKELVKYSGLKRTADVAFYRSLDKDCDAELSDQVSRTEKDFRVDWEAMVKDWMSSCYDSHPYVTQSLKSDFSNADDVLDDIEDVEKQIEIMQEFQVKFLKALKESELE